MASTTLPPLQGLDSSHQRKRWTVAEVYGAMEAGVLGGERFELLNGEIVLRMSRNPKHSRTLRLFTHWLISVFGSLFVQVQLPIRLKSPDGVFSEPEPDLAVTSVSAGDAIQHPGAEELRLVVEIGNTSAALDLTLKRDLYARSEIAEYWLIDVNARTLTVHRRPVNGVYTRIDVLSEDEMATPLAAPEQSVRVGEFLP